MVLWTFQNNIVLDILKTDGVFRANWKHVNEEEKPYHLWMTTQMEKRLPDAPDTLSAPIWSWYQWHGQKRCKPDLRYWKHLFKGTKGIRIEFEAEGHDTLLADFDLYENCIFFKQYIPKSETDWNQFERLSQQYYLDVDTAYQNPNLRREIEISWERIFDLDWHLDFEELVVDPKEKKSIMALTWELRWEQVRKVDYYNYQN
jgi:hypothetical protein